MGKSDAPSRYLKSLWDLFASIRLTVVLLLTLAATSIFGTVIPQNESPEAYARNYGEPLFRVLDFLGLFDMYHSWWFQLLLVILTINIVVCSINRLSATWKIIFAASPGFAASRFRKAANQVEFAASQSPDQLRTLFEPVLQRRYRHTDAETTDDAIFLFAEKGRWTRLGVYIVHSSVIFLLLGGLVGSFLGFEGHVNIPEGAVRDAILLRHSNQPLKLPFAIRCEDFHVSFYETGAPEEFRSRLVLLRDDQPIHQADIVVNDPLRYEGINIFQSSYGNMRPKALTLSFTSTESGMAYSRKATVGEPVTIPEGLGRFVVEHFHNHYQFMGMMDLGSTFLGTLTPPGGEPMEVALPLQHPDFDKMIVKRGIRKSDVIVAVTDFEPHYYTGLQVNSDPGVWLVYAGFVVMIIGCFITFYMSHQRIGVELANRGKGTRVTVSGMANKNKLSMDRSVEGLARRLSRRAGSEKTG
jgi:cytochrome c biogenesis protein